MLSLAFGKRKSKKNARPIQVVRATADPEPFALSEVFEIRATPETVHSALPEQVSDSPREPSFLDTPSPRVELKISNEPWFSSSDILNLDHNATAIPPRGDSLPRIEEVETGEVNEVSANGGKQGEQGAVEVCRMLFISTCHAELSFRCQPSAGVEQDEVFFLLFYFSFRSGT